MADRLTLSFQRSFDRKQGRGAPILRIGEVGLLLHARELGVGRDRVSFVLACSYKCTEAFAQHFADPSHAIVLFVEDPVGGRATCARLADPFVLFDPPPAPSSLAGHGGGDPRILVGGWVTAIVDVGGFASRKPPRLYVRASVQTLVSPTLELDFAARSVAVYAGGKPRALRLVGSP